MSIRKLIPLAIDVLPPATWGKNLRQVCSPATWKSLSAKTRAKFGDACAHCLSRERLHCHEVWTFDYKKKVQRLKELRSVCAKCHAVIHYGRSLKLARDGYLDIGQVDRHYKAVTGASTQGFRLHRDQAAEELKRRASVDWIVDFGAYAKYLDR